MSKNVLFVVEGGRGEPRFLDNLMRAFRTDTDYKVFTYKTNIHKMIEGMMDGEEIDHDLDFLTYLRSVNNNAGDASVLDNRFSDIYLFFDMDPQDSKYNPERISKAAEYFNDSTYNGKLYLNYPMLESYRHISSLDDLSYLDTVVRIEDVRDYKERVHREGMSELTQFSRMSKDIWIRLVELNLRKTGMILGEGSGIPSHDMYVSDFVQSEVLARQLEMVSNKGFLYVLNTSLLCIVDYNPSEFLAMVADQSPYADAN